ncbi:alkaline phosphatase family protein [Pseudoxanthomonas kalamensis DSM 18571]|uniref:alkaline phosphatase family protein n=1 Tax=Pseudoxanthomonas kalamensis TaxID=289483 RepID=UPI001390C1DC|nr:ectonucleotide pyrophosphatase/phosphodiesterase [Pseudoxanthomonas kalamensis]KAF1711231.1 alkaline phosphatase family protein [Pseudoxanthomonas kalamensis DSM 18571]
MRLSLPKTLWLAGLLLLAGCASRPPAASLPSAHVPLLLVSVDGLRPTDVTEAQMPALARLARQGVVADQGMVPSYPSLTFPNHYTLVTGLRPDHHGIIQNTMRDDTLGPFALSDRNAVGDGRWWNDGLPIWVSAEQAGLRTATMFWPGSEAEIHGHRPSYWLPFDKTMSPQARVERLLTWLDLPADLRPTLLTLYFDQVDHESHDFGPDSERALEARQQIDRALGSLLDGLQQRGLAGHLNLIVVSDHGMTRVAPGHVVAIEDMAPAEDVEPINGGQVVGFVAKPGRETAAAQHLLGRHDHYQCWRKQDLPARWHYGTHPRVPSFVCQMDEGWDALPRKYAQQRPNRDRGSHGFDPELPSMRATFIASGPAFRDGVHLPPFDNVDVYPLLAHLLGIAPAANDGDLTPLLPALKAP